MTTKVYSGTSESGKTMFWLDLGESPKRVGGRLFGAGERVTFVFAYPSGDRGVISVTPDQAAEIRALPMMAEVEGNFYDALRALKIPC